jgi:hypothetical protein
MAMPVQANNGMSDMMRVMMEMFMWMMGGGAGGMGSMGSMGSMGGMANPLLANSMIANPLLGNSLFGSSYGRPAGWGYGQPYTYNNQGLYPAPAYPGSASYLNPYGSSFANPYSGPYTNATTNPYATGSYNNQYNNPYNSSYRGSNVAPNSVNGSVNQLYTRDDLNKPFNPGQYNRSGQQGRSSDQASPLVLQPMIVNPGQQNTSEPAVMATEPKFPVVSTPATVRVPAVANYPSNTQPRGFVTPLSGRWQGVNGEYLELGEKLFRLRSNDTDLKGEYELKNNILKAEMADRKEPVYMQYQMSDGHLMFRSENGELMLFRRMP